MTTDDEIRARKAKLAINTEHLRIYDGKEYDEHCSYIYLRPELEGVPGWARKRTVTVHGHDPPIRGKVRTQGKPFIVNFDYDEEGNLGGIEIVW